MRTHAVQSYLFSCALVMIACCFATSSNQAFCADTYTVTQAAAEQAVKVTVRLKAAGQLSSGIVIGKTGEILTVNHGLPDGVPLVKITDFNGNSYNAKVAQRHEALDLAVLKITGEALPKHVAIVATAGAVQQQSAIAVGYPARASTAVTALVRLGTIERNNGDLLRSTCQLTVGDSGGGIFDLDGRLIGLNQRIGAGRSANIHATVGRCLEAIPLVKTVAVITSQSVIRKRILGQGDSTTLNDAASSALKVRTLQVWESPQTGAARMLCHATLWSSEIAVTKLSELRQQSKVLLRTHDLKTVVGTVIKQDRRNDLAVLKLQKRLPLGDVLKTADCRLYEVIASGGDPTSSSIIGRVNVSSSVAKPVLGCGLAISDNQIQVDQVSANSAAAKAKLMVDDLVFKVDNLPIRSFDEFAAQLEPLQPGDWTVFEVLRNGKPVTCQVQLGHDPAAKLDRTNFLDGAVRAVSIRRTGFENSVQHDGDLRPSQMGSPMLSLSGELLGIHIAVHSRETIIAIPAKTVQALIDVALVN